MWMQLAGKVLPIVLLLAVGFLCRVTKLVSPEGIGGLKTLVEKIFLPVVLLNAFATATYSPRTLAAVAVVLGAQLIALGVGMTLRKPSWSHGAYFPFLLTGAEGGMLGYALYGILMGEQFGFASVDLGQTVFVFTLYFALVKGQGGEKLTPRAMLRQMVTNHCFLGMVLGLVMGVTGFGEWVLNNPARGVTTAVLNSITEPTSALVLVVVGYGLTLNRKLLKPVLGTVLCRLAVMGTLCLASSLVLFRLVPYDPQLQTALLLLFSLPAPFVLPVFTDLGEEKSYVSTTLSLQTLCTVLLFFAIATYTMFSY